jgi:hypothetical protein
MSQDLFAPSPALWSNGGTDTLLEHGGSGDVGLAGLEGDREGLMRTLTMLSPVLPAPAQPTWTPQCVCGGRCGLHFHNSRIESGGTHHMHKLTSLDSTSCR